MIDRYRASAPVERSAFWACFGGCALDARDVQMFSLIIPALIATWRVSHTDAGPIGSLTLAPLVGRLFSLRKQAGPTGISL